MAALDQELARLGAVLVEERVLRRIIKRHRRLPGMGLQIPHAHCYTLPRSAARCREGPGAEVCGRTVDLG